MAPSLVMLAVEKKRVGLGTIGKALFPTLGSVFGVLVCSLSVLNPIILPTQWWCPSLGWDAICQRTSLPQMKAEAL